VTPWRISVVLPVLNGDRWLDEALDSIAAQTTAPAEVICVDDGSTDRSREISAARDFVTVVSGPKAGIVAAYSAGIAAASGDAVTFLGQDDRFAEAGLELLARALEASPDAGYACGQVQLFTDEAVPFSGLRSDRLDRPYRARIPETVLIKRAVLTSVGLSEKAGSAWDTDLFLRLDEADVVMAELNELVAYKRLRPDSTIHNGEDQQRHALAVLRRSIVRRREGERT
jgi:glycosyltransferase involved in cell wall biosynthesis